ncbi:unnamed protein product [Staurois parvus]|uniref:Uncharacterized protein n=1 Tax=Staurois parvus TaxID=386267 RepID=A0ABN9CMG3_9NEOB|nr:unnamed protein product [Staurois parvus]
MPYECCLLVPISDACQCPQVMPVNAHQYLLISATYLCPTVPPISAYHCSLISAHQ